MKKFLAGLLVGLLVAMLLATAAPALAGANGQFQGLDVIKMFVDGREVQGDTPAVVLNGRTMVPVRFVSEALGATVNWDAANQTINITQRLQIRSTNKNLLDAIKIVMQKNKKRVEAFPGLQDKARLEEYVFKGWAEAQNDIYYISSILSWIPSPTGNAILAASSTTDALNQEIIFYSLTLLTRQAMDKNDSQLLANVKSDMEVFKKSSFLVQRFQVSSQKALEQEVVQQEQTIKSGYFNTSTKSSQEYIN